MGVFRFLRFFSFWVSLFLFFTFCFSGLMADDGRKTPPPTTIESGGTGNGDGSTASPSITKSSFAPFRPSIAVIVGVLTTMFSITFLLLLYAKHCKRSNGVGGYNGNSNSGMPISSTARRNSGIDRTVIESLPIFRFGSLRGQKDGLECAVCLNRFESTELLRLLPKCNHAFHVECVDTWLDAHSTCPLCRYRVDPEDVLLVEETKLGHEEENETTTTTATVTVTAQKENDTAENTESRPSGVDSVTRDRNSANPSPALETPGFRRVSGRHSSAGEKTSHFLELVVHRPSDSGSSSRRSLDSASLKRKNETVTVGCFDHRSRKDGLLLSEAMAADRENFERRFGHRIIVSAGSCGFHHRWSDVQQSDLLYLRSEMIITNSGRYASTTSRPSISFKRQHHQHQHQHQQQQQQQHNREEINGNGRSVINSRCMSEITGLSRFSNRNLNNYDRGGQEREREASVGKRWLAWASSQKKCTAQ